MIVPPADKSDSYHEEFTDELAHIISLPEYDRFYFDLEIIPGDFTRVLEEYYLDLSNKGLKLMSLMILLSLLSDCGILSLSEDLSEIDLLVSFPFGNEDIIFDPGIFIIKRVQSKRFHILPLDDFSNISFVVNSLLLIDPSVIETFLSFPSGNENKITSGESKVYIEVFLWGNRLPISDGSLPLSSSPPHTNVADEAASTGVVVRHRGAATTITSLDAGQGSGNIDKTPFFPHDSPLPRVNTLGSDEGKVQGRHEHDMESDFEFTAAKEVYTADLGISTTKPVSTAGAAVTTASVTISTASPTRVSTTDDISIAETLMYIRRSASKDKGKAKMDESESVQTKTKLQQRQERLGNEASLRLQEQLDEEERQRIARVQEEASSFNVEKWEATQARVEADEELAHRLQAEEREKYSEAEKELSGYSFDELKTLFETTIRRTNTFTPIESDVPKIAAESSKRPAEEELDQESSKRQKTGESSELAEEPKDKEEPYPIIDWEIYFEGTRKYWKIIRVRNHTEVYQLFDDMLRAFDRDDLVMLWSLVKEKFNSIEPTDDKEREIWVELKRLFEPDIDDELWKLQKHIHDLNWKLYDSCGVHHVSTKDGVDIYMLVEREYSLSRGVLTQMLGAKLLVEQDSEMSRELLRKTFLQGRKIDEIDQDPDISLVQHDAEVQGRHEHDMESNFEFTTAEEVYTADLGISTTKPVSTAGAAVTTASVTISTASPTRVSTADDISIAETLVYIRRSASKDKIKKLKWMNIKKKGRGFPEYMKKLAPLILKNGKPYKLELKLYPIIDWEIYFKGTRKYWKIIRGGNHTKVYQLFDDMLRAFDRDDLVMLWSLVKEKFNSTEPTDDKEREIWVELKRLFEPDIDDELWKL
ncbi:hypothetical protein Tco_0002954 [Tanacetum coccineum]